MRKGLHRQVAALATAAVLVWAGDVQFASAQPVPADEEAIMSNWIIVAQENDYLGEEYDRESLTFGTWAQMYEPSGDFYDGSAAAPFADDLVPAAGLWATTVYSGGLPIGAVIADGTDAWVTSGSDVAAGMDAMQGNERVLFVAMADGWWLIDGESANPLSIGASLVTPGGGALEDIFAWTQTRHTSDPNMAGGGEAQTGGDAALRRRYTGAPRGTGWALLLAVGSLVSVRWWTRHRRARVGTKPSAVRR